MEQGEPGAREARTRKEPNPVRRLWKILGPGLISGSSDADPVSIGSFASVGASQGLGLLWTPFLSFPMMAAVQYICSKIALASGMGLSGVLRRHYPHWLFPMLGLLVLSNAITVGVDIGAIAAALNLFLPLPIPLLALPVTLFLLAFLFWGSYRLIERVLKCLALSLLGYLASTVLIHPDPGLVFRASLLPVLHFEPSYLMALVALLGTNVSPYIFFWQMSEEVELQRLRAHQRKVSVREYCLARWDSSIGMLFYNSIMYFIMLGTALTLGGEGIHSAADAARALRPVAGEGASLLFAIGVVSSGLLAVPVISISTAHAVTEALALPCGLDRKPRQAKAFYGVLVGSLFVGMLFNYLGFNPIHALFWSAVLNGFLTPPLLGIILLVANNRAIMGEHANGWSSNFLGGGILTLMVLATTLLLFCWG